MHIRQLIFVRFFSVARKMSLEKAKAALKDSVFVNGAWVKPEATFDVIAATNGQTFAACPQATPAHADEAAKAAAAAFKTWGKTTGAERAGWLRFVLST